MSDTLTVDGIRFIVQNGPNSQGKTLGCGWSKTIVQTKDKYGLTVFLIEHHMDLVMKISDYIYVIDFGSEISEGVPSKVQNDQRVIDAYLGVVEHE